MTSTRDQPTRRGGKAEQATEVFAQLLAAASQRGFFGAVTLTLNIQDGHIQNMKASTERHVR
ncbi:MAG: hypothetical protein AAF790_02545 [Planctomycetota bacterium]